MWCLFYGAAECCQTLSKLCVEQGHFGCRTKCCVCMCQRCGFLWFVCSQFSMWSRIFERGVLNYCCGSMWTWAYSELLCCITWYVFRHLWIKSTTKLLCFFLFCSFRDGHSLAHSSNGQTVSGPLPLQWSLPNRTLQTASGTLLGCRFCSKTFHSDSGRSQHERLHMGQSLPCGTCGRLFSNKHHLQRHTEAVHQKKTYSCDMCDKALHTDGQSGEAQERKVCGKFCAKTVAIAGFTHGNCSGCSSNTHVKSVCLANSTSIKSLHSSQCILGAQRGFTFAVAPDLWLLKRHRFRAQEEEPLLALQHMIQPEGV